MNNKAFVISVILIAFMAFGLVSIAFAGGPKTPDLEIHIYAAPDEENAALELGTIDLNDWPLTKFWVDKWALIPETVTLRDYVELGMMEIDINNQQWPTGDPDTRFYKNSSAKSFKGKEFRKAVAYLTDRDSIVRDVLKGLGFRMDLPLPPFQTGYIAPDAPGLYYDYSKANANTTLNNAGFTLLPNGKRLDPTTGTQMAPITFYIRQDDPNRRRAGEMLTAELRSLGVDVNAIITERTVCYKNVMVLYAYNLYTGGWSLSVIPDQYHDLYSSFTYYGPTIGWSQNYPGFCHNGTLAFGAGHETEGFDYWALKVKYPTDEASFTLAAWEAGRIFLKYCAIVPMYCSKAVKAYRTGWTGVVNNGAGGIDNYWTFLNMDHASDNRIDWGFKSDIEQLNQVSSEWLWDQNVLGLMYESLTGVNPFNLVNSEYFIASAKTPGNWNATDVGGDADATFINFTLRNPVSFHNNETAGTPCTASDVQFSFDFQKACGPGIAWNYPSLSQFDHAEVYDATHVAIFYKKNSFWAIQWAGGLPILNRALWSPLWTNLTGWQATVKTYDPANQDKNENGVKDLYEDGTGAWYYLDYEPGEWVTLKASTYYYLEQGFVESRLATMFHDGAGDLGLMARSFGMILGYDPNGTDWNKYNVQCDLNLDGEVNATDVILTTKSYGKTMG
jgi:ABC-type transport system substrate-binding protein